MSEKRYITTPIYYVNDKPHIGHCYTTTVADVTARANRLVGRETFFLTGTDEHAEKVVAAAAENGMSPQDWSDRNASEFEKAFELIGASNDDFIRTSQSRHIDKVIGYIRRLQESGDIYLGDYEGWFDVSQEEYIPENEARKHEFLSPVTKKPLERRIEKNYFFKLSKYADALQKHVDAHPEFVLPDARRNEILGRLRTGLLDIPISRAIKEGDPEWGIAMPDDPSHRIYVWIDALFNYLSTVDADDRREYWPATVHYIAKDILWFHAVIWPCMLMALGEPLPRTVYTHAYWIAEGQKMSKSLGNFIEIERIAAYCDRYSRDAFRWYLTTNGPLGSTDADFVHKRFVEVYNADLANGIGNATSRVANMIGKYYDGKIPDAKGITEVDGYDWPKIIGDAVEKYIAAIDTPDLAGAMDQAIGLSNQVDAYIGATQPFKLAKKLDEDPGSADRLAAILYHSAEALRVASLLLAPAMPGKMSEVWSNWSCAPADGVALAELARYGGDHSFAPGHAIAKGEALFMRADVEEAAPTG